MSREVLILWAAAAAAGAVLLLVPGPLLLPGPLGGRRAGRSVAPRWLGRRLAGVRRTPTLPITELLSALAAELSAGQPTDLALRAAAEGLMPNPCPQALAACHAGTGVADALRRDASAPGGRALRGLAACWEVADQSGAGLAVAVARLAEALRAGAQADAQLAGEVAAVRTSARLLAGLPLLGLAIGQWIGAEPISWLVGSWIGRGVLAAGLMLQVAGMVWLHRMVASARAHL